MYLLVVAIDLIGCFRCWLFALGCGWVRVGCLVSCFGFALCCLAVALFWVVLFCYLWLLGWTALLGELVCFGFVLGWSWYLFVLFVVE